MMTRADRAAMAEYVVLRARAENRLKDIGRDELLVSENLADLIKTGGYCCHINRCYKFIVYY